jgi:pyrroloquinoline quinone biosynthesis protein B
MRQIARLLLVICAAAGCSGDAGTLQQTDLDQRHGPFIVVLGIAQDGGYPQAGTKDHPAWSDRTLRRHAASLGIVDPQTSERWIVDATPDFREQLHALDMVAPVEGKPGLSGILLTHAHIGHYTGLMHLGHEALGASEVPVWAMPRMSEFLTTNGPWSQLVRYGNIELHALAAGVAAQLSPAISVTPLLVPHRQEYSEVVGFVLQGPQRSVLFLPDIDSWEEWDNLGTRIEDVVAEVDIAYVDATFYANGEIAGRDMSGFPHPFIRHSMQRFEGLPEDEKAKVRFIHLNHTNPALREDSAARQTIEAAGFRVAEEGESVAL